MAFLQTISLWYFYSFKYFRHKCILIIPPHSTNFCQGFELFVAPHQAAIASWVARLWRSGVMRNVCDCSLETQRFITENKSSTDQIMFYGKMWHLWCWYCWFLVSQTMLLLSQFCSYYSNIGTHFWVVNISSSRILSSRPTKITLDQAVLKLRS